MLILDRYKNIDNSNTYLGMLLLGSSLSLANPPNRKTRLPTNVKLCPSLAHGVILLAGALGCKCFHSQRLA